MVTLKLYDLIIHVYRCLLKESCVVALVVPVHLGWPKCYVGCRLLKREAVGTGPGSSSSSKLLGLFRQLLVMLLSCLPSVDSLPLRTWTTWTLRVAWKRTDS